MQYFDKLNFLMNITQTSNKELAAALSVDRSLISLMRSGKRGLSRKGENVKKIARFFSQRVTAQYQRHALSEMLDKTALRSPMPIEALADYLEKWLLGDPGMVGGLIEGIESIPLQVEPLQSAAPIPDLDSKTSFFYGEEGRQEVMRRMMQILRKTEPPSSVLVVSDDNLEWLLSNYMLTRQLQADLLELLNKGITFHQNMPAMNFINRYTEAMQFWLPMYATGQMKVYYYLRLRDDLYRRSIIIVPGRCVRISTAIGLGSSSDITMFSTNPELVKAFTVQFQEHLALCRLALLIHASEPILVLDIRRPEMVLACREHLLRKAEKVEYSGIQRAKSRMELKALIRELQE